MNFVICEDYPGFGGVLDGEFSSASFSSQTSYASRQMVAFQGLHILDLERFDEKFVQSEQREGIIDFESQGKRSNEIFPSLETTALRGFRRCLENEPISLLSVEAQSPLTGHRKYSRNGCFRETD